MKKFEAHLKIAKARQRRGYMLSVGILLSCLILVVGIFAFSTGVSVRVSPADASELSKIQITDGFGTVFSGVVYSLISDTKISVSAEGFASKTVSLAPEKRSSSINVTLEELPGHLLVTTVPETKTVRWSIDGKRAAIAPSLDQKLPSGTYTLDIDNPFYKKQTRSIEIGRGQKLELAVELHPVDGEIEVSSSPSGVMVTRNDKEAGRTPLTLTVQGGQHLIKVGGEAFKTIEDAIEITNTNQKVSRNYQLLRKTALLKFQLTPRGGTLLVNGNRINAAKTHAVDSNTPQSITYMLDGYRTEIQEVKLGPAETKIVFINLEPELAKVVFRSTPTSKVHIDGALIGETPFTLTLPTREHKVQFSKPGFRSIVKTVEPTSGQTTKLHEKLQPEDIARLNEAPSSYVNKAGIELLLFSPTSDFITGAPRHEKGQRANEFQRRVKFKKPFYAGRHEVTNAQFSRFKKNHRSSGSGKHPAVAMSWLEAAGYCNWLSIIEKRKPVYSFKNGELTGVNNNADGYRLLTEAEWEWLARAAGRPTQTIFPWGNKTTIPTRFANIADETSRGSVPFYVPKYTDGFAGLSPVGSFAPEASGLYDLAGNASEWVHDYYSLQPPAKNATEVDPMGPTNGGVHVVKGASWRSGTRTTLRAAYRDGLIDRRDDVGFRIGRYL